MEVEHKLIPVMFDSTGAVSSSSYELLDAEDLWPHGPGARIDPNQISNIRSSGERHFFEILKISSMSKMNGGPDCLSKYSNLYSSQNDDSVPMWSFTNTRIERTLIGIGEQNGHGRVYPLFSAFTVPVLPTIPYTSARRVYQFSSEQQDECEKTAQPIPQTEYYSTNYSSQFLYSVNIQYPQYHPSGFNPLIEDSCGGRTKFYTDTMTIYTDPALIPLSSGESPYTFEAYTIAKLAGDLQYLGNQQP